MNLEMIWLIVPIAGLLSQLGGSDYAPKAVRRFGIPILMAVAACYFAGFSWWIVPMVVTQWAVFTLPFTLIGDGVPQHPMNWGWLPLWGVLLCSSPLWLSLSVWPAVAILGAVLGMFGALSNVKTTAKWFQWKFVEFIKGCAPAIVLCFAVTL